MDNSLSFIGMTIQSYQTFSSQRLPDGSMPGAWWQAANRDDRIECLLCPRKCCLKSGDRGFCFVRENREGQMVLSTYGKSTGFCIDPIEKKPLNHFFPGTPVLSFGTAGCNLGCKFCQNWDISKSREVERLSAAAEPEDIALAARETGCQSVAFTYNDPVIWAEYAIDTARACHAAGVKTVAVTAGYICPEARCEFFAHMDAANVDLKAFTEEFYQKITYSHLQPVLETIQYLKRETQVWFELTNLIIPDANDSPGELRRMCGWVLEAVGAEVPIHFTAFHPDFRMQDRSATDPDTLSRAYEIATAEGLKFPYVGNVHDIKRQSTFCNSCGQLLIARDWYQLGEYAIDSGGHCKHCQAKIPGRFGEQCGDWGAKRQVLRIENYTARPASVIPKPTAHTLKVQSTEEIKVADTSAQSPSAVAVAPHPAVPAKMLKIDSLKADQRGVILKIAAASLAQSVVGQPVKMPEETIGDLSKSIVMGAFVSLKRGDVLRGCCGVLGKPMTLGAAVMAAAQRTARDDQRMAPISPCELQHLRMDVTLLGPFRTVEAKGKERVEAIRIGKHGLTIQRGQKNGLLLPSVAAERGWDAIRFLQAVCAKAGLPSSAWESDDTTLATFDGETLSSNLGEHLPINLPTRIELPISPEQLSAYGQVIGQNIVALLTGGTPSYVVPHLPDVTVNAIVLSMQWGSEEQSEDTRQGNALQVSFRPGVPLQSTLYQMSHQAAELFQRQRFSGQLQLGLTLGFDPAMHGYGATADLNGVDGRTRAIIISDSRYCGFVFDAERSPEDSRSLLRQSLPISSRDAGVHSLHVISTMPSVISIAGPTAIVSRGARPAAVAGKFYPAEDAARRALVEKVCSDELPTRYRPLAIMVPHAGLKFSGRVAAKVWRSVEDLEQRSVVIISPKHTTQGVNWSVCPFDTWQLSRTKAFASDAELAQRLAESVNPLQLDAASHQYEHGIEVQLPILEKLAPNVKVVGLALHGGSWEDIQNAASEMAALMRTLPNPPLLVISSDMNHFAQETENRRLDRLALDALASGDPQRLIETCSEHEISMCGLIPAAFVMETLRQMEQPFKVIEVDYTTSAEASGDRSQVVGYAGALFLAE